MREWGQLAAIGFGWIAAFGSARADVPAQVNMFGSDECERRVNFGGGAFAGYNYLMTGYENYSSLWVSGVDLYLIKKIQFTDRSKGRSLRECRDNIALRLTFAYAPVVVPQGNSNFTEDYLSTYFSILYRFGRGELSARPGAWFPYVGGGLGIALNRTSASSLATGAISGTQSMLNLNISLGILGPAVFRSFRISPEVRANFLSLARGMNIQTAGQVSLVYWPNTQKKAMP
jgi:hypothetical protein